MSNLTELQKEITGAFPNVELRMEEPLFKHTSFKIGGPCEVFALPKTEEELSCLLAWAKRKGVVPAILGSGTNVLAADEGYRGLIVCTRAMGERLEQTEPEILKASAGVTLARLASFAASLGLGGLEFAHGIPGSVGGGLYMNAGAYGGEMKQVTLSTRYMDMEGKTHVLEGEAQDFSYRHSAFTGKPWIIIEGTFKMTPKPEAEIREAMQALLEKRRASQPLDLPSAGSTFKRPVGGYAAALIDQAGLKGFRVGDAAVSTKHAGFVVNLGQATAEDVLTLIEEIKKRVLDTSGILLEPEVVRL